MQKGIWPFIPDHISNDLKGEGLHGQGIFKNEELQGAQTLIKSRLDAATAIYELYENFPPVRTDSILEEYGLEEACHYFRQCTERKLCLLADESISKRFMKLRRSEINKDLSLINNDLYIPEYILPEERNAPKLGYIKNRPFIFYDCQFLGYREMVFPIFYRSVYNIKEGEAIPELSDDHVIAVLIVGEICIKEREDIVHKIQNAFFNYINSNANKVKDFFEIRICTNDIYEIRKRDIDLWDENRERLKFRTEKEYEKLIEKIHSELCRFEENLHSRIQQNRERFALRSVDEVINKLNHDIPNDISITDDFPLQTLYKNISYRLTELCDKFSFHYAALFAIDDPLNIEQRKLPIIAYGVDPNNSKEYEKPEEKYLYDTSFIPDDWNNEPYSATDPNSKLHKGIPPKWPYIDQGSSITILTYPLPFHPKTPIVIICGHETGMGPTEFEFLQGALRTFDAAVVSFLSSILARLAEQMTTNSFRVLRHETEPQTQGLKSIAAIYLKDYSKLRTITKKKAEDICNDIDDYLDQINFLFANARSLLTILLEKKKIDVDAKKFNVIGDLFYKIKDLFRIYFYDRGMCMPLDHAKDDPQWPRILADRRLMDLMLFNLVNNAIKYGNRGTNIYLNYSIDDGKYILKVTNYGTGINTKRDIFRLFVRSEDTKGEEGAGIGLAISRAIAQSHDGDLTFNQKVLSDFNIPFIKPFLNFVNDGRYTSYTEKKRALIDNRSTKLGKSVSFDYIVNEIKKEKDLIDEITFNHVVSGSFNVKNGYIPFASECIDNIIMPTVEVVFRAELLKKNSEITQEKER